MGPYKGPYIAQTLATLSLGLRTRGPGQTQRQDERMLQKSTH